MKTLSIILLTMSSLSSFAQGDSCKILKEFYQSASRTKFDGNASSLARVSTPDLIKLHSLPMERSGSFVVRELQQLLDLQNEKLNEGKLWYFESLDSERKLTERLRKECPSINTSALDAEISFYESKYVPYDKAKGKIARKQP